MSKCFECQSQCGYAFLPRCARCVRRNVAPPVGITTVWDRHTKYGSDHLPQERIDKIKEKIFARKEIEFQGKFDPINLNLDFIPYYDSQEKIIVSFGHEKKIGRIGMTAERKPTFFLETKNGLHYTINRECRLTYA